MKKFILVSFLMIIILTSCSKKVKEVDNYENTSFFDRYHNISETKDGYYSLYNELLTFIDKETLKPYLVSNEKSDIRELLKDDFKKNKSDAFFKAANEIFYESGKIYISSPLDLNILDEKNNTLENHKIGYSDRRILHKGVLYYLLYNNEPGKEDTYVFEKYDTISKKYTEITQLKPIIEKRGFDSLTITKFYVYENKIYVITHLHSERAMRQGVIIYDIETDKIDLKIPEVKDYDLTQLYVNKNQIKGVFNYNIYIPEDAWKSKGRIISDIDKSISDIKEVERLEPLKSVIYSNNKKIITPFDALIVYKSYNLKDDGLENKEYILDFEGKQIKVDEKYFYKNNSFTVKLSDGGDILLSYEDGNLVIIRDGKIYEIFK